MENTTPLPQENRTYWFSKCTECFFAALAAETIFLMALAMMPQKWQDLISDKIYELMDYGTIVLAFVFGIIYSIYWHKKEKKGTINSGKRHAWFLAFIRYWLALEIASYGFAKVLGTQFAHSFNRDDTTVGDLNGFNLTWNYFSYSYAMAVIIAMVQIIGSSLLLFRKTTLLGVTMLLPVMLNILLINVFYDIAVGAFLNSIYFSLGLIYLLSRHWAPLKKVYLNAVSSLPAIKIGIWKNLLKIICIAGAFTFIFLFTLKDVKSPIEGKWKVISMEKNGVPVQENAWLTDSTAWNNMYFEAYGRAAFSANPYIFDKKRSTWTNYKLDTLKKTLTLDRKLKDKLRDTTVITLISYSPKEIEWKGRLGNDTFHVKMLAIKKRKL